ncbi:Uncharacterised protein [Raoultella planticola]|uniref:Uncharacterized protein n=1 Tax=Raoultella planticola TaxID=575 RepID=A0A485CY37_RAOPL|nr:Uncharacterised protein [Raoultella planticola]
MPKALCQIQLLVVIDKAGNLPGIVDVHGQRFLIALILQGIRLHPLHKLVIVATACEHKGYYSDKDFFHSFAFDYPGPGGQIAPVNFIQFTGK